MITVTIALDPAIANHFLLRTVAVSATHSVGGTTRALPVSRTARGFTVTFDGAISGTLEVRWEVRYHLDGQGWMLSKVRQVFAAGGPTLPALTPIRWFKAASPFSEGVPVNIPPLHPHLAVSGFNVTVSPKFLDITDLFMSVHGRTPWFRTLEIVRSTDFTLRVLACLLGRPLIWYVVIPKAARESASVAPHLSYWAADYGGIDYVHDTELEITTRNHNTTVNRLQCGGHILCSYLLSPLTHADYVAKAPAYTAAHARFEDFRKSPKDQLPPELHRLRSVLSYATAGKLLYPKNWDIPFGFERTIENTNRVLVFPQVHNGDAGVTIRLGLRRLVESALTAIATGSTTFTNATVTAGPLVLSCYSEAGGNLFTASDRNLSDLKAIVCVEPQYVNEALDMENGNHVLGRVVIPKLIRNRVKVVIVARRAEAWQRAKYLPRGVPLSAMTLLPTEAKLGVVSFPPDPAHPFQKHRLGRLLDPPRDETRTYINGAGKQVLPARVPGMELLVDNRIDDRRKQGLTDKQLIADVFPVVLNDDNGGGSFTHNFMISGGEDDSMFDKDGKPIPGSRPKTFVQRAMEIIG